MNEKYQVAKSLPDTSSDAGLVQDVQKAVLTYAQDLRGLNVSTERDFLSLGSSLAEASSEAQTIATLVTSVVDAVKNEEVERDLGKLQNLFELISDHFRKSQLQLDSGSNSLHRMGNIVSSAYGPLAAFRKIVKHLRMLSVSTRIETARLADTENGFDVLAQNVESLSVTIALKAEAFFGGLSSLKETTMVTAQRLVSSRSSTEEQTELMLEALSAKLPKLSEKRLLSLQAASSLGKTSDSVSAGISEVVLSLQFHDITRQQIEHVAEVFEETGADQSTDSPDVLKHVIGLQIDQLNHAKDESISAVGMVTANLRQISFLLSEISTDTVLLMSSSGGGGKSFLLEFNNSLSLAMASFLTNEETNESLSATVKSVTGMVDQLAMFVTDIEEIGSEIELIALNAQIKASHTAENGGALGVLAEAIRNLSDEAGSQTLVMTDALKGVRDAAFEPEAHGHDEKSAGQKIYPVKEQIEDFLCELGRSQQSLANRLDDLDKRLRRLTGAIEKTVRVITAHDKTRNVTDKINEDSEKLLACGIPIADSDKGQKEDGYLELVRDHYTMDRERHMYQSYLSGVRGVSIQSKDSNLGDNVELF